MQTNSVRFYSDKEPLTKKLITDRVLLVLKLYDKIDATKVRAPGRLHTLPDLILTPILRFHCSSRLILIS